MSLRDDVLELRLNSKHLIEFGCNSKQINRLLDALDKMEKALLAVDPALVAAFGAGLNPSPKNAELLVDARAKVTEALRALEE